MGTSLAIQVLLLDLQLCQILRIFSHAIASSLSGIFCVMAMATVAFDEEFVIGLSFCSDAPTKISFVYCHLSLPCCAVGFNPTFYCILNALFLRKVIGFSSQKFTVFRERQRPPVSVKPVRSPAYQLAEGQRWQTFTCMAIHSEIYDICAAACVWICTWYAQWFLGYWQRIAPVCDPPMPDRLPLEAQGEGPI